MDIRLVRKRVEQVDSEYFAALKPNDILFIDSTHTVKCGGDVCHEVLEILPRLQAGVFIHVHDILFPHDYPADWLIEKRIAFNEQYLLEAFLSLNDSFSIQLANYWLWLDHVDQIDLLLPEISKGSTAFPFRGASFWMRKER